VNGRMSTDDLRALPAIIGVPTAARVLGIGRTAAYRLVRDGEWPTPLIRIGGSIRVPTAPLVALVVAVKEVGSAAVVASWSPVVFGFDAVDARPVADDAALEPGLLGDELFALPS
jgi:predicted DNA-binding transcriptional regulator AlpA